MRNERSRVGSGGFGWGLLAQEAGDGGEELGGVEGLGEVDIRALEQPLHHVVIRVVGAEQDDREVLEDFIGAYQSHQRQAIQLGHLHIGDHEIERGLHEQAHGLGTIGGGLNRVASIAQIGVQYPSYLLVVINNKDAGGVWRSGFGHVGLVYAKKGA